MPTYSLDISDFNDASYTLLGITTSMVDYQLAYLLNRHLEIRFKRAEKNLEFEIKNNQLSFSIFNFDDQYNFMEWFLIANKFKQSETNINSNTLFSNTSYNFETTNYLIPERKKIDYFIKITGEIDTAFNDEIIQKIKSILPIEAVFEVNPYELKSKDFLIF